MGIAQLLPFFGVKIVTVQVVRKEEDTMYMCSCCRGLHSREEHQPIAGMCPECYKSKEKVLIALYNDVERELSHMISTHAGAESPINRIMLELIKIRDDLRTTMRTMGWQGSF